MSQENVAEKVYNDLASVEVHSSVVGSFVARLTTNCSVGEVAHVEWRVDKIQLSSLTSLATSPALKPNKNKISK